MRSKISSGSGKFRDESQATKCFLNYYQINNLNPERGTHIGYSTTDSTDFMKTNVNNWRKFLGGVNSNFGPTFSKCFGEMVVMIHFHACAVGFSINSHFGVKIALNYFDFHYSFRRTQDMRDKTITLMSFYQHRSIKPPRISIGAA